MSSSVDYPFLTPLPNLSTFSSLSCILQWICICILMSFMQPHTLNLIALSHETHPKTFQRKLNFLMADCLACLCLCVCKIHVLLCKIHACAKSTRTQFVQKEVQTSLQPGSLQNLVSTGNRGEVSQFWYNGFYRAHNVIYVWDCVYGTCVCVCNIVNVYMFACSYMRINIL